MTEATREWVLSRGKRHIYAPDADPNPQYFYESGRRWQGGRLYFLDYLRIMVNEQHRGMVSPEREAYRAALRRKNYAQADRIFDRSTYKDAAYFLGFHRREVERACLAAGSEKVRRKYRWLMRYLRRALKTARRMTATCTGAFILAQAGLLEGRRATTHWHFANAFRRTYPNVVMDEDRIFVVDGPIWTSAGMSAGIDLAIALVEKDLGAEIARLVAKKMVVYHRRAGGQSQHSALLELDPKSDRIQTAMTYAKAHLDSVLSVEELAQAAHLSPRQFSRVFRKETGKSPANAIEHLRVEAARLMMEAGRHSFDEIANESGFGDRERMRRAFLRAFGQSPQALRRAMQTQAVAI